MDSTQLKNRTKKFALDIIMFLRSVKQDHITQVLFNQLLRSATSVAANYRAACKAKSKADFINKIGIVLEEADESLFWLELINESELLKNDSIRILMKEANELTAIFSSIRKTSRENG